MTNEELKLALEELYTKPQFDIIQKGQVVFYGSSSFRLWDDLKKTLNHDDIVNLAFGGSTLKVCADKFEEIVTPFRPRSIVIYAGDNDIGNGVLENELFSSFIRLTNKIRFEFGEIPIFFLSIKPSIQRSDNLPTIRAFNLMVQNHIQNINNCQFIDIHHAMLLENGKVNPALFEDDGLHMNAKGYAIWGEILRAYSNQIFN